MGQRGTRDPGLKDLQYSSAAVKRLLQRKRASLAKDFSKPPRSTSWPTRSRFILKTAFSVADTWGKLSFRLKAPFSPSASSIDFRISTRHLAIELGALATISA